MTQHPGPCKNVKYLANKNFECGCNHDIDLKGYENHCCICKCGLIFHKAQWGKNVIGALRCWQCKIDDRQFDQPNQSIKQQQPVSQKRFTQPKIECKNIIYLGEGKTGECKRIARGFVYVEVKEYRKWNDQTDQIDLIKKAVCNKCTDHEEKIILQKQEAYKPEFCHMCGVQGSRANMQSEEGFNKPNFYCDLNCLYAKKIQRKEPLTDDQLQTELRKYTQSSRYAGSNYGSVTKEDILKKLNDHTIINVSQQKLVEQRAELINEVVRQPEKMFETFAEVVKKTVSDIKENAQETIIEKAYEKIEELNAQPEGLDYWKAKANFNEAATKENEQLKKQNEQLIKDIEHYKIAAQTANVPKDSNNTNARYNFLNEHIKQLETTITDLKQKIDDHKETNYNLENTVSTVRKQHDNLKTEVFNITRSCKELEQQNSSQSKEIDDLHKNHQIELDQLNDCYKQKLDDWGNNKTEEINKIIQDINRQWQNYHFEELEKIKNEFKNSSKQLIYNEIETQTDEQLLNYDEHIAEINYYIKQLQQLKEENNDQLSDNRSEQSIQSDNQIINQSHECKECKNDAENGTSYDNHTCENIQQCEECSEWLCQECYSSIFRHSCVKLHCKNKEQRECNEGYLRRCNQCKEMYCQICIGWNETHSCIKPSELKLKDQDENGVVLYSSEIIALTSNKRPTGEPDKIQKPIKRLKTWTEINHQFKNFLKKRGLGSLYK